MQREADIFSFARCGSPCGYAVTQLNNYNPKLKSLVISSTSDLSFPVIDWSQYTNLGDYIIVTDPSIPKTYEE